MNKSETITHLATALAKAQAEMPVAVFDAQNKFLNNKYASLGAVIQASRPILAKHKLSLVQFPISGPNLGLGNGDFRHLTRNPHPQPLSHPLGEGGVGLSPVEAERVAARGDSRPTTDYIGVESILMHESGEFVAERIVIPLTEEKGKSKVQSAGSTLTYLRRYSWASILGMYSDEDSDGSSPAQAFAPKPATAGKLPVPTMPPVPMQPHQNN